ncbi:unnamed protein product [Callosobruchus maculatus]|uniref:C2H2-type domain-containing protein n=1 Tax=Callosobruchus maculatus TaxID=64391 RepID=A0A653DM37_CALMS|nr:unnamed protein product [Callosobruchus maculatus]
MDSLQLSKLLDIETKVDPTIFSADSDSENGSKELHVVHREPQTDVFICYNCSYMSLSNDDLLDHVSAGNCVLEQSDSSVTETKILNSQLSRHPGTASRHNIGSRVTCDQSSIIKKTPGKHATYKIHTCKNGDYITTSNSCSDCHTSVHSDSASAVELEICTYCGKTFKRKSLLDYHMVTVHLGHLINTGKMHAGMFKTVTPKQLQRQRKDSREASSTAVFCSETDLTSDNCGLNINAESSQIVTLGDHMSKNKLEHSDPKFDSDTDSNEKVKLDDVISKKQPEHSSNSDPSIHQCKHCNFKTTRKVYLNRHIRKYHDMSKNYTVPCVHCGQVFTSKRTLGGHIIRKHPDFISSVPCKLYECTSCDYKTTYKSSLDWHMVMHSCTVYGLP